MCFCDRLVLLILAVVLPGCVALSTDHRLALSVTPSAEKSVLATTSASQPASLLGDATRLAWWQVRFKKQWNPGEPLDLYRDLLLADQVIKPVLLAEQTEIRLWRFHRRAAPDQAGNQFSFIFFSTVETATRVMIALSEQPLLAVLLATGVLETVRYDVLADDKRSQVGDTSDARWPAAVQAAWPYYIMGSCQAWLQLVESHAMALRQQTGTPAVEEIAVLLQQYEVVSREINQIWRLQGPHVFLHHLNAIFGYEPLAIRF